VADHLSPKAERARANEIILACETELALHARDAATQARRARHSEATVAALRTELALVREALGRRDNADLILQLVRAEGRAWRLQRAIEHHAERPHRTEHPWDRELYERAGIPIDPIGDRDD
jgi:hypothetical protein